MKRVEDDDDSDIDTEEIKGQLRNMQDALQRHFGHHKDVARLKSQGIYGGKKEFVVVTPNLARATPSETLLALREELEKERKRRMEEISDGLDEDVKMTTQAKKGVNEELLHLFAFHDAKFQAESVQTRQKVEEAKETMHAELLRRSAQKVVDMEVEKERKRKLEELEKMMRGEGENEVEIAKTNENLSEVQCDLKNAFKIAALLTIKDASDCLRNTDLKSRAGFSFIFPVYRAVDNEVIKEAGIGLNARNIFMAKEDF